MLSTNNIYSIDETAKITNNRHPKAKKAGKKRLFRVDAGGEVSVVPRDPDI